MSQSPWTGLQKSKIPLKNVFYSLLGINIFYNFS